MTTPTQTYATKADFRKYTLGAAVAFVMLISGSLYAASRAADAASDATDAADRAALISKESRAALVASGQVALVTGCNRDYRTQGAFVELLERLDQANAAQFKAGKITAEARALGRNFYRLEIKQARALVPDCRVVADLLTSNPDVPIPVIKPLYPKP
jgi:hypothetical protein